VVVALTKHRDMVLETAARQSRKWASPDAVAVDSVFVALVLVPDVKLL